MASAVQPHDIRTIFSFARHNRKAELEAFLDANTDTFNIDDPDNHGNSILCVACQNGHKRIAKVALRRECNINFQNKRGNTPLHFCYQYGFQALAEYLQSKGADPEILNKRGLSCYEGLGIDWDRYGSGQVDEDGEPIGPPPEEEYDNNDEYYNDNTINNNLSTEGDTSYNETDTSYDEGGTTTDQSYDEQGYNDQTYEEGYYDEHGNWVYYEGYGDQGHEEGYYDENGNWVYYEGYGPQEEEVSTQFDTQAPLDQVIEEVEEEEEEEEPVIEEAKLPPIPSARKIEPEPVKEESPIPTPRIPVTLPDPPHQEEEEIKTNELDEEKKMVFDDTRPPVPNIFDAVMADDVEGIKNLIAYGEKIKPKEMQIAMHWAVLRDCSGIASALRPMLSEQDATGGTTKAIQAIQWLGSSFSDDHREHLLYDACTSEDIELIKVLIDNVNESVIDEAILICAKRGYYKLVKLLMPKASPEGCLRAIVASADGKHLEVLKLLHANVQEYFEQNYNSRESLFGKHKDIEQSLHRALKDADEANLPEVASLLMTFTSGGSVYTGNKGGKGKKNAIGPSALKILDVARTGDVNAMADCCKNASQQNIVAALHTACLDGNATPTRLILPHVNEVAKRQAFMAASAKGHDSVMQVLLPSLDKESLARMFLAAGANGRIRTIELMILGGVAKITEAERGRALLSAAASGHVAAVTMILPVVQDQRTRARALVSAAARGKVQVVYAMQHNVTKHGLLDPSVIGPLHMPFLKDANKDHSEIMQLLIRYANKKAGYSRSRYTYNDIYRTNSSNASTSPTGSDGKSEGHMSAVNMLRRIADQRQDGDDENKSDDYGGKKRPANFTPAPTLNIRMAKSDRGYVGSARMMSSGRNNFGSDSSSKYGQKTNGSISSGRRGGKSLGSASARPSGYNNKNIPRDQRTSAYRNLAKHEHQRTGPNWDGTAHHGHSRFRWKKGPLIGRGRFGAVYLAMNIENGELLAVKQVPIESQTDKRMLQREISLMRSMSVRSDNVVFCVAAELFGDEFSIFMEYIPGGSIKTLMKEFGPLRETVVQAYTKQILDGLKVLHNSGVAHRDIKADNLLLTDKGIIKLADFGSAKRISTATMANAKAAMALRGSPLWMAPEVIRQEIPLPDKDPEGNINGWKSADIWSLGCTIIEMFTSKPPFDYFSNPTAAMFHIASCKEPPEFPENMHEDGLDLLKRCFAIKSNNRPSISELMLHPYPVYDDMLED